MRVTKAEVIKTASDMADRNGLHNVSLKAIAENLGIRTPSLYNHIGSLDELLREIAHSGMRTMNEKMIRAVIGKTGDSALKLVAVEYLNYMIEHPGVYGKETIVGFNFDIDLSEWEHTVIAEKDRFFIGIKMSDNKYHSFHGINRNGNVGTLLYVHGNDNAQFCGNESCYTIADLTENFIKGNLSFDDSLEIVKKKKITYAPDTTMQAMFSDRTGRVLIIEPGIGYRLEKEKYSLITNYSILKPELTNPYVLSGDNRYEKAKDLLQGYGENFSISNAFDVLRSVRQEGLWATRVSFVYSVAKNKVYYVLNNDFKNIAEYQF